MASKNLGAVIQRAISDGAFRRQLQSDPAAALRGFNLTPDEIAAIRSGDSSKLMSLGVDQRMSKAFSVFDGGAARSTVSDLNAGGTANTLANDSTATAREGIVGDPASTRDALTTGNLSGTRAVNDTAPFEGNVHGLSDPTLSGTRAVHDSEPSDLRGAINDNIAATTANRGGSLSGDMSSGSTRAVHDSEPGIGTSAINDNIAATTANRGGSLAGDMSSGSTRAVHDSEPGIGTSAINDSVAATAGRAIHDSAPFGTPGTSAVEDPNSPEYAATQDAAGGTASAGGNALAADDNYALSSRMANAGDASSIRQVHDVAPFEGNVNAAAPAGGEFLGGDARLDPGTDSAHGFVPSDSADVQREMLEDHGNALGNTGGDTGDEHSWG